MENVFETLAQELGSGTAELTRPGEKPAAELDKPADNADEPANPDPQEPAKTADEPLKDNSKGQSTVVEPVIPNDDLDVPEEKFYGRLSKMTGGSIKSEEEFAGLITHYNELLDQAEKGFEPKFENERAKLAYQILSQSAGSEPEAAMRTLRAISFNPEGKTPKEILFEAYLVDPKNSDIPAGRHQEYFEAEFEHKYGDLDGNLVKERMLSNEVKEASKTISEIAKSFKTVEAAPAKISEQVQTSIFNAVEDFGGVKLAFSENPQESDYLTMALDPNEIETLKQDLVQPGNWWNEFVGQFTNSQGQFDDNSYKELAREFFEMKNHQKKAELAYQHGYKLGQLAKVNEARNASNPKEIANTTQAASKGEGTIFDAWEAAKKG